MASKRSLASCMVSLYPARLGQKRVAGVALAFAFGNQGLPLPYAEAVNSALHLWAGHNCCGLVADLLLSLKPLLSIQISGVVEA